MKTNYGELLTISELIWQILLVLGGSSVLLFFTGYVGNFTYMTILGVPKEFVDLQYNESIISGFIQNLYLLPALNLAAVLSKNLFEIKKNRKEIESFEKRLSKRSYVNSVNVLSLKKLNSKTVKIDSIIREMFEQLFGIYKLPLIYIQPLILLALYFKSYGLVSALAFIDVDILSMFAVSFLYKKIIKPKEPFIVKLFGFQTIMLFIIGIVPMLNGYIRARVNLYFNYFNSYKVTTRSKTINGDYIYFGKESYFFISDNKIISIPKSEILELQKY